MTLVRQLIESGAGAVVSEAGLVDHVGGVYGHPLLQLSHQEVAGEEAERVLLQDLTRYGLQDLGLVLAENPGALQRQDRFANYI